MKMFETVINDKTIVWVVGENGVTDIVFKDDDTEAAIFLENEKFGEVVINYKLSNLPFYATA